MNKKQVDEFLTKAHVFYVATVDKKGNPKVRPFGAHVYEDGELYFMTMKLSNKVHKQMKKHRRIEICAYSDEDKREWIRLTGKVKFVQDPALVRKFMTAAPPAAQKHMENPVFSFVASKLVHPFKLEDATVSYCNFFKKDKVYKL